MEYLDDLDADFRVFYRIDDIETLPGPRFLSLAVRSFAYQGVMAARAAQQQEDPGHHNGTEVRQVKEIASDRESVLAHPSFAGLVSWGSG